MATPVGHPSGGVEVSAEFLSGYLVITSATGEWLGSWPAVNVTARVIDLSHLMLTLGKEQIRFESDEPEELIEALGGESRYFRSLSGWQKTARRARMSLARFDTYIAISNLPRLHPETDSALMPPVPAEDTKSSPITGDDRETVFPERENTFHAEFSARQEETIEWIASATRSWLDYFFALGEGSVRERLEDAANGLDQSAKGLLVVRESLDGLIGEEVSWDDRLRLYCESLSGWADAFEMIASGARQDQRPLARDGFVRMEGASEIAERVVKVRSKQGQTITLSRHLKLLNELRPSKSVARRTVERARAPWRRALTAAGSPFDWRRSTR